VIVDPLAIMFSPGSFAPIRVPVQLSQSERGGDGVLPHHVEVVDKNLLTLHEYYNRAEFRALRFPDPIPARRDQGATRTVHGCTGI
jgi:hypothetical protein